MPPGFLLLLQSRKSFIKILERARYLLKKWAGSDRIKGLLFSGGISMPFETMLKEMTVTFFISMVPVIELRGAIPVGIAAGLSPAVAYIVSVLGNLVPVPFILLLIRRIFDWLRHTQSLGPVIEKLERRAHLKGRLVTKYRVPGLILLVGIPLPGTGAWTGALVAALLDIRLRTAIPAILVGLLIAGAITLGVTMGVIHIVF
jgi:uncharacterized membrane protein